MSGPFFEAETSLTRETRRKSDKHPIRMHAVTWSAVVEADRARAVCGSWSHFTGRVFNPDRGDGALYCKNCTKITQQGEECRDQRSGAQSA
jgi:hypothetical protein